MAKKITVYLMILISFASISLASETLDTYYPMFETCLQKLGYKLELGDGEYNVIMNYKALLNYMEDLDKTAVFMLGSIALEWNRDIKFPPYDALFTKEGKRQLVEAIQTAQAKAILTAANSILTKEKVWL